MNFEFEDFSTTIRDENNEPVCIAAGPSLPPELGPLLDLFLNTTDYKMYIRIPSRGWITVEECKALPYNLVMFE